MHSTSPTREAAADERVEVDPARDDVAARVLRGEAELLERLGLDERELVAVRVRLGERAAALVVAVALQPAAGVRGDLVDELDRASASAAIAIASTRPAVRAESRAGGDHRATSAGATT